jgi:hypothetical protein
MLKKTITYEDFNGETISEDYFFHLSKAELVELELSHKDGLSGSLTRIIAAEDNAALVAEFKSLIMISYGKKSPDGRNFIKSQELRDEFESSGAYSSLFMELVTDTDSAINFIRGIIPADMAEEITQAVEVKPETEPPALTAVTDAEVIDKTTILSMNPEELKELGVRLQTGEAVLGE